MKWCIDAGHCSLGGDTGAQGNGLLEQDITWLIADKLRNLLEAAGQEVVMTREYKDHILGKTENESLNRRSQICNDSKCDRFISIHGNRVNDPNAHGTEVLIYAFGGQAEPLADAVQKEIVAKLGTYDRGVKVKNCSVLRKTNCPAILVETAFLSNEADSLLLRYRHDDFAEAIFSGICEYCGIEPVNKYSYDNTVNQMILDTATSVENMQYWEQHLGDGSDYSNNVRTIIERYQMLLKSEKMKAR